MPQACWTACLMRPGLSMSPNAPSWAVLLPSPVARAGRPARTGASISAKRSLPANGMAADCSAAYRFKVCLCVLKCSCRFCIGISADAALSLPRSTTVTGRSVSGKSFPEKGNLFPDRNRPSTAPGESLLSARSARRLYPSMLERKPLPFHLVIMERILITVIAVALLILIGSATMLIYSTGHSVALPSVTQCGFWGEISDGISCR
ncbi:hypothetical protein V1279_000846 [Bradyrhizobium sp. AZCC 1610]